MRCRRVHVTQCGVCVRNAGAGRRSFGGRAVRPLERGIVRRPSGVHLLKTGEQVEDLIDGAAQCSALRVVPHLMDDRWLWTVMAMRSALPSGSGHQAMVILARDAVAVARVDIEKALQARSVLRGGSVADRHVVRPRGWRGRRIIRRVRVDILLGRRLALASEIVLAHIDGRWSRSMMGLRAQKVSGWLLLGGRCFGGKCNLRVVEMAPGETWW
jgi:hypothetical protein